MNTLEPYFVNRNHNHAVFEHGLWIVRKGATHADKGMYGVLPMNMSHGTYIILGKGNANALYSAPHGAGRRLSRRAAKETVEVELHALDMEGIVCDPVENTLDESSFAYKDTTGATF